MKRIFVFLTVLTLMLAAFVAPVDAADGREESSCRS